MRLADVYPAVSASTLLEQLVPPPLFDGASFESYHPDSAEPTQAAAVEALLAFAGRLEAPPGERSRWWRRAPAPPEGRLGVYLDGGFGVGKTHLLAALWHVAPEPKVFATFVELTHLVGAMGFADAVTRLQGCRLVCIDEFELDDPGDTVLMSTLLERLTSAGVHLAATSNTLPDRLGEDRFSASDFLREIHALAGHFDVLRVDGPDYRHRDSTAAPRPSSKAELRAVADAAWNPALDPAGQTGEQVAVDEFGELLNHLAEVHPSAYGAMVDGIDTAIWHEVTTIEDQAVALRFVVLVDRLYDRDVSVVASGVPLDQVFTDEMLRGGYRKKYFRALSRLVALARPGDR